MRFAIAAGVHAQSLPVTSEINELVAALAGTLDQEEHRLIHQSLREDSTTGVNPKLLNGIRRNNGRKSGHWRLDKRVQHNEALKNANAPPRDKSDVVECDPNKKADVGVLACDEGTYCVTSQSSSLGGVCEDLAVSSGSRSLQNGNASIIEIYYEYFCNKSSPTLNATYNCDCEGFDGETLTGDIVCAYYDNECLVPYCNDTCVDATITYYAQGADQYGYSVCLNIESPDGVESGCYGFYSNLADGSGGCTTSWNGADCTCTVTPGGPCDATIDCPGDGPSGICTYEFFAQFAAAQECLPGYVCDICPDPDTVIDAEAYLLLPDGNLSCVELGYAATSGLLNSSQCVGFQALGPICCTSGEVGSEVCHICGEGGVVTMPGAEVEIPTQPLWTCAEIEQGALIPGNVGPGDCVVLQAYAMELCGCTNGSTTANVATPTITPGNSTMVQSASTSMAPSEGLADLVPDESSASSSAQMTAPPSAPMDGSTTTAPTKSDVAPSPVRPPSDSPADGAIEFFNTKKNAVSFLGLSMAMAVIFTF